MADDLLAVMDALEVERARPDRARLGRVQRHDRLPQAPERFRGLVSCAIPHLWPRERLSPKRLLLLLSYQGPLSTPSSASG